MNHILFDDPEITQNLLPLTFTRPVAKLRVGILTIAEKWEKYTGHPFSFSTGTHLQEKFPQHLEDDNLLINGGLLYDDAVYEAIRSLEKGEVLSKDTTWLALRVSKETIGNPDNFQYLNKKTYDQEVSLINHPWDIFLKNAQEIRKDFQVVNQDSANAGIQDEHTKTYARENIFVSKSASVKAAVINAEEGPVYIGPNAKIQEGAIVKGPFALCEGAQISMGAKMRGDSTIGPYAKAGGEIGNSVIQGYSNKAHDGFLGHSVIGEWCNLGADTNNSNLKNNYSSVKVWNYGQKQSIDSGQQFCGLIMGDHAKCAINTIFNTGTVVGVAANIFGNGFPPKFVPSFTWGGIQEWNTFELEKAYEVAAHVMDRRDIPFDEKEKHILAEIHKITARYRHWEKRNK